MTVFISLLEKKRMRWHCKYYFNNIFLKREYNFLKIKDKMKEGPFFDGGGKENSIT